MFGKIIGALVAIGVAIFIVFKKKKKMIVFNALLFHEALA
jgi:hypothetical protein